MKEIYIVLKHTGGELLLENGEEISVLLEYL